MKAFTRGQQDYHRINGDTLVTLLRSDIFDKVVVVDARSDREYFGGHIKDALQGRDNYQLEEIYSKHYTPNTCFVFHCQFSENRGPKALQAFREIHQQVNSNSDLVAVVLDAGYKGFYQTRREFCKGGYEPQYRRDFPYYLRAAL